MHLGMNGGMAIMIAAPGLDAIWFYGLFGVTLVALGMRLAIRLAGDDPSRSARISATVYHMLATGAMIWAVDLMSRQMAGGMMGHDATTPRWPSQVSLRLFAALVFAVDASATTLAVAFFPAFIERTLAGDPDAAPPVPTAGRRWSLVAAAVPHIIMDMGMAAMLGAAT